VIKIARDSMYRSMDLAGVTVHSLDPGGLQPQAGLGADSGIRGGRAMAQTSESRTLLQAYQGQIRVLPDRTGGRVVTNTNAPELSVPAVMAESAVYYVLGFDEPPVTDRGPKVDVTVGRKGVKVHVQRAFERRRTEEAEGSAAPSGPWPAVASGPPGLLQAPSTLAARAITSLLPARGLPMSASVVPLATPGSLEPVVLVVSGLEPPETAVGEGPVRPVGGAVELYVTALTMRAQSKTEERQSVDLGAALSRRLDVVSRLALKPGSYEIRSGAATSDGRTGSVITYVDVPNFRHAPLSLSGLALTTVSAGRGVVAEGAGLLPFVPTARRAFAASETLRSYMKVYQGGSDAIVPVQLEVRIVDARGQVMLNAGGPLNADRWNADRSADIGLDMPLSALAPGEYLFSVSVAEGKDSARRDVRFSVIPQ